MYACTMYTTGGPERPFVQLSSFVMPSAFTCCSGHITNGIIYVPQYFVACVFVVTVFYIGYFTF